MVTFAQAQERAEDWINGDVPAYQHREVRVREFELGFVVWAEDRADGPRSDGGAQRLVIARDSGEATLWPALPVGEVIRRYEEEYGRAQEPADAVPAPPARVDLNQTSFLLTPPEWLQEAADRMGIGERGGSAPSAGAASAAPAAPVGPGGSGGPGGPGGPGGSGGSGGSGGAGGPAGPGGAGGPVSPDPALPQTQAGVPVPGSGLAETQAGVPAGPPPAAPAAPAAAVPPGATPWTGTDTNADAGDDRSVPLPATVFAPPLSGSDDELPPPSTAPDAKTALMSGGSQLPPTAVGHALGGPGAAGGPGAPGGPGGAPTPPPPPPSYGSSQGAGAPGTPPPGVPGGSFGAGAPQSQPPAGPAGPAGPATPARPLPPHAGDIADAATSKAAPPPRRARGGGSTPPPPPGVPGAPGARPGATPPPPPGTPGAPSAPAGGYVPTQLVSALEPDGTPQVPGAPGAPGAPGGPGTPPGGMHHAATMFADPGQVGPGAPQPPSAPAGPGAPGAPQTPPGAPGSAGGAQGAVHHARTVMAPPVGGPGAPPPPAAHAPGAPGAPSAPGVPGMPPGAMPPPPAPAPGPGQPPAYGYPQVQGLPTVGPGYQAVLRYRAQDGSEQQLIRRSAPGTPHPEWQIFHELRAMNVPPDQVLELHTELESCELPGAYCARMIREQWPQARITSIAPYGTDHASRQQGMQQLLVHQGELHQVADGPARPAPVRAPLPAVQPAPPIPPEAIAQELAAAFGPGVFRFEQAAVSRQGVPPVVAHTLVAAGLPLDMGPFFWAQAQPGRPVPTLAELAAERGVQPAPDAGSYLVMGSDFGKAICVQYGTANIVAVPVEAGPGGASVPPQFVNTGLPEFARCLALLGRMWRLRYGLNQEQAGRWTVDFQAQLVSLDPAALGSPDSWWSVLLEQMWDGLL
ncbi:SUKH-4 family immunity protein [Streptomyces antibioticus]|uniref:SUKH-4 family immunity protein n=1 Tax=Streptomyces antibioticus TaxID=1890 RepID=UPI00225A1297|nr:SUKH-4 family immunity protein [Streptomyces antibioticus]MCX4738685.1 SUKH-4 family immunity protein [Streptomyces antibioticus]